MCIVEKVFDIKSKTWALFGIFFFMTFSFLSSYSVNTSTPYGSMFISSVSSLSFFFSSLICGSSVRG